MRAAIRDITERKQAERLLQEKERLATLGTTAAVFAHEIGNPLDGISTSLQIVRSILETAGGELTSIRREERLPSRYETARLNRCRWGEW